MTAILSYQMEYDRHTLFLKSATKELKLSNSLPHFLLKTAILNFYLQNARLALIIIRKRASGKDMRRSLLVLHACGSNTHENL